MPTPAVISVNPKDAPRSELSNTARDEEEIRTWWCRPFVVRAGDQWEVHALDGGESDSTTWHGLFDDQQAGVAFATELHEIYWSNRSGSDLPLPFPYEETSAGELMSLRALRSWTSGGPRASRT